MVSPLSISFPEDPGSPTSDSSTPQPTPLHPTPPRLPTPTPAHSTPRYQTLRRRALEKRSWPRLNLSDRGILWKLTVSWQNCFAQPFLNQFAARNAFVCLNILPFGPEVSSCSIQLVQNCISSWSYRAYHECIVLDQLKTTLGAPMGSFCHQWGCRRKAFGNIGCADGEPL